MTIEEKQKEIEKYCDRHICNICALRDFHLDDCCYLEKDCNTINKMYNAIIEEGVVKELKKRKKDEEVKEPTIMQDRVPILMDQGTMTIKGTCYEDVLNILCRNGYATNMHTRPCKKNLSEIEHIIVFWKESFKADQMKGE